MKRINFKRGLALLLSGAMAFSASFSTVFAETTETSAPALIEKVGAESVQVTICGNHPIHDEACGYVEAKEGVLGVPCGHTCEQCAPIVPVLECDCVEQCTPADVEKEQPAVVKTDCPICGAEDADLTACMGETSAFYGVETLEGNPYVIITALDFTAGDAPTSCVGGKIGHDHTDGRNPCFTWDKVKSTLTLHSLTLTTTDPIAMNLPVGATVEMNGESTITSTAANASSGSGIFSEGSLTFKGWGSIEVTGCPTTTGSSSGIAASSIIVERGTITATGGTVPAGGSSYGISVDSFSLTGGELIASGATTGLECRNSATITGGTLVAKGSTQAMNKAPNIDSYPNVYAIASLDISGSNSVSYIADGISNYNYLRIGKCPAITKALDFTKASVYLDCTDKDIGHIHRESTDKCFLWDDANKILILNNFNLETADAKPIILPDKTKIEINGSNRVFSNYGNSNSSGIYGEGALTFTGYGMLNVTSGSSNNIPNSKNIGIEAGSVSVEGGIVSATGNQTGMGESYGVHTTGSVNVKGVGSALNATGSSGDSSYGISAQSVNVSDNGKLEAEGADANYSYGIYGSGTSSIHVSGNGSLNARSVAASASGSYGISVSSLTLEGGNLLAASGEVTSAAGGHSSTGLTCTQITITSGTLKAAGDTRAMSKAPDIASGDPEAKITASKNVDGSSPETYDEKNIASYKYLKVEKNSPVTPTPDPVVPSGGGGYTPAPAAKPSVTKTENTGKEGTRFMQGKNPMTGFVEYEGKTYFADKNGYAVKSDWVLADGKWYHTNANGEMQNGWNKISGKWYLMAKSGAMVTGWNLHNYEWYFMSNSGDMKTGWVKSGNNWYYMSGKGAMTSGKWIQTSGKWYYLRADGTMAANTKIGSYAVDSSGAWIQ